MANNGHNSGIMIFGAAQISGNVAVGDHATVISHGASEAGGPVLDEIRLELARLAKLLQEESAPVPDEARRALELALAEAAKPKPDKTVLSTFLDAIATGLKSIASIGATALTIKNMIGTL